MEEHERSILVQFDYKSTNKGEKSGVFNRDKRTFYFLRLKGREGIVEGREGNVIQPPSFFHNTMFLFQCYVM